MYAVHYLRGSRWMVRVFCSEALGPCFLARVSQRTCYAWIEEISA